MKLRNLIISASTALLLPAAAYADAATESFVKKNANEVLNSLNNPDLSSEERTALFSGYMEEFANIDAVSKFVLGRYANRFSNDEMARYQQAFRTYALAVYQNELDAYRGNEVVVEGSHDRSATDSFVETTIERSDGRDMQVIWRVLQRNGEYQVVDVGLDIEGNLIWLAQEQQAQFRALLDRNNGSADALISKIDNMTDELQNKRR